MYSINNPNALTKTSDKDIFIGKYRFTPVEMMLQKYGVLPIVLEPKTTVGYFHVLQSDPESEIAVVWINGCYFLYIEVERSLEQVSFPNLEYIINYCLNVIKYGII